MLLTTDQAKNAPSLPGVYIFKSKEGQPIYIGKAKNLKERVASYFSRNAGERAAVMLSQAASLEFIITDNEAEALVLESRLIKEHYPKYNIDLRDSERFTYILITKEKFPRMLLVRRSRGGKIRAKGELFGPFTSGSAHVLVASTLRKIFKLRTCRLGQKRPCLQYHLGFCMGPCAGLVSEKEYNKQVEKLRSVLSGGKGLEKVIAEMEEEMKKASSKQNFERAIELRNSIRALSALLERQKFESSSEANEDFISFVEQRGKAHFQIFRQVGGVIRERKKFEFSLIGEGALSEFLSRFYEAASIPRRIYLEQEPESKKALEQYLSAKRGGPVSIVVPKKGDKASLLGLLRKNILLELAGTAEPAILELKNALFLPALPRVIECFDVSNLYGAAVVGSMVQFVNGKPNKSNYRRFKIRTVEGQDDFASMREIVLRRYQRLKNEGAAFPDLIVIDGGKGQLHAALSALSELRLSIPCIALAKESEEIYHPDMAAPLHLPRSSPALKLLQFARDEAHRFGIAYHRLLRKNRFRKSEIA
ncbi:MAG: excinuclease ABC subunit UvrC [Candidatus Micrarchaeota archaeon]|nr:excinuclease ABC subunit UvrC [Candidatus Micrarchaeota archaeon]